MGTFNFAFPKEKVPARVDITSKYPEKHSVTLVKNENFLRGRNFFATCFKKEA